MKLIFPSREFDDAVAAVCHGNASNEQMAALNELLLREPGARDEYLFLVELHSRLASEPDLFTDGGAIDVAASRGSMTETSKAHNVVSAPFERRKPGNRILTWAMAASLALLVSIGLLLLKRHPDSAQDSSTAVAVLANAVDAHWSSKDSSHSIGAALTPGWLRLEKGLAEVVFYSGARLIIEGPAEVRLISAGEAYCSRGLAGAEVPHQASGFRLGAPHMTVVDLGTEFGVDVKESETELHVFKGKVELQTKATQNLVAGEAASVENSGVVREIPVNQSLFARAFDLQEKSKAIQAAGYRRWRGASARLDEDRSLLVHFDFENSNPSEWMLHNVASQSATVPDASIVGCQWTEGRWPQKRAIEFDSISDRICVNVPGEFDSLTFSTWVNVKGLDRSFNSLFMADGFSPGKVHWQIRNGGVLDLGIQGPRIQDCQIFASPPVVGFDRFGQWIHVAVVVDGPGKRVTHFVNGEAVSRHELKLTPPFLIGDAELGNWNPGRGPATAPYLIRHFAGDMDEFALFSRALSDEEIRQLYSEGNPQSGADSSAANLNPPRGSQLCAAEHHINPR